MGAVIFSMVVAAVIFFSFLALMMKRIAGISDSLKERLNSAPDFTATITFASGDLKNAIALDTAREKIAVLLNPRLIMRFDAPSSVYAFADLNAVEVVRDNTSVIKVDRGSQLKGAVLGGVLLGPTGLLLGGMSGSRQQESKIKKLALKLYTNDLMYPVREIIFWDSRGEGIDASRLQPYLRDFDQWYGRLRAIIERQKRR